MKTCVECDTTMLGRFHRRTGHLVCDLCVLNMVRDVRGDDATSAPAEEEQCAASV